MPNKGRTKSGSLKQKRRLYIDYDTGYVSSRLHRRNGGYKSVFGNRRTLVPHDLCSLSRHDWNMGC